MSDRRYRLNVDFDNSVIPFLYNDTGEWTFTVPSTPNFMGSRYVVFLPGVMVLNDIAKIPAIAGYTRVEDGVPSAGEFRTIPAASYSTFLLKDGIEFPAAAAGVTLTITNLWTIGSTVAPDIGTSYSEDKKGFSVYTTKSTGINTDLNLGILMRGPGFLNVFGVELSASSANIIPVSADLTASRWHIVYCDVTGVFSFEATTGSDYNILPMSELDSKAPVNGTKLARYKSGDSSKRAIAMAYSLPTQSAYNAGTAYVRRNMVEYGGKVYVCKTATTGNLPTNTTYWIEMGTVSRLFYPKIFNLPESTFGTGALGDVTLDGTGLGATATPFYGLRENVTGTVEEYPEYEFNNLTINGVCYCGKSDGLSLDPVVIRVKGTLTIGASGQLNGDARGANGGAGGAGGTGVAGGAGGAGAKSGRPIHIYANKIVDNRTTGFWLITQAGNPASGSGGTSGGSSSSGGGGGGGGGGSSTSEIKITTNSDRLSFISRLNQNIISATPSDGGNGGNCFSGSNTNNSPIDGGNGQSGTTSINCVGGKFGRGGTATTETSAGTSNGGQGGYAGGLGSGGGGGGGGGSTPFGPLPGTNGAVGSVPAILHSILKGVIILDKYDSREAI